jgi:prepilin-type N-terminal cleavage/methylation domain-containing protein
LIIQTWQVNSEKGFTLIETIISLALVGLTAVAFLGGLSTSLKATVVHDERAVVESLAKSQLENIEAQDYISALDYNCYDPDKRYNTINIPADLVEQGYTVQINPPTTIIDSTDGYWELQSLSVEIQRYGEDILTISNYKLGRGN